MQDDLWQQVFGSRFHHKIKLHANTELKSLKTRLMVMGNQMAQGKSYIDAFSPVPSSTAGLVMMALAAALNLKMHCVYLLQAFIQASWDYLPEDVPGTTSQRMSQAQIFIQPGVVYEVLCPLYGTP